MNQISFEETGWSRVDITKSAQDRLESELRAAGVAVEPIDVAHWETCFRAFRHLSEYDVECGNHAGDLEHCLLKKVLEHLLSLPLARPKSGMTGVVIGSW